MKNQKENQEKKLTMELEMIDCTRCKNPMPKLRKEKFGYNFCVNCSDVAPKRGVSFQRGVGEDTWDETVIMDSKEWEQHVNQIKKLEKFKEE